MSQNASRNRRHAGKKKLEKELKCLKKKAGKADAQKVDSKKKIKQLKIDLSQREKQITKLQRKMGNDSAIGVVEETEIDPFGKSHSRGVATNHKESWKKFSYLRNRYEFFLEQSKEKTEARRLANEALIKKHDKSVGYSEDELDAILS
ncbi:hypothetical protein [Candidatus Vondammii sp. HM_W22]|uniref:hypothetical protein n=1 Tax=Candidatus Vondammii sp. HM_W22 TaxID=2687299 RepID=UPI001F144A24|nr:hypothetical protein [Candidatus Vondammii sp. HM_W22]